MANSSCNIIKSAFKFSLSKFPGQAPNLLHSQLETQRWWEVTNENCSRHEKKRTKRAYEDRVQIKSIFYFQTKTKSSCRIVGAKLFGEGVMWRNSCFLCNEDHMDGQRHDSMIATDINKGWRQSHNEFQYWQHSCSDWGHIKKMDLYWKGSTVWNPNLVWKDITTVFSLLALLFLFILLSSYSFFFFLCQRKRRFGPKR